MPKLMVSTFHSCDCQN